MKKLVLFAFICMGACFASCGNSTKSSTTPDTDTVAVDSVDSTVADSVDTVAVDSVDSVK